MKVTIDIKDELYPRYIEAFSLIYNYQDGIETKEQFLNRQIKLFSDVVFSSAEVNFAAEMARIEKQAEVNQELLTTKPINI